MIAAARPFFACLLGAIVALAGASALGAQSQPPPAQARTAQAGAGFMLGPPEAAPLEGEALSRATEEVADHIRCPVCQGLSIADSPMDTAIAMKSEVREMLAEGYSADQIFAYFEASYGEFIRLEPKAEGFNLVVWIAPVVGILVGVGIVARRLAQGRTGAPAVAADEGEDDPTADAEDEDPELAPYLARVRREVGS